MFNFSFFKFKDSIDNETLYRIKSINAHQDKKRDNGRFVDSIEDDVKDLVNSKNNIDKIFLKMSFDDEYKNILYSNQIVFSDKKINLGKMNFVDYMSIISSLLSTSQLLIFFKTVPENLLFNNDIRLQDKVFGEMTPLLRICYMNPKAFRIFLKHCPEYEEKIKSFSFSNTIHTLDTISINSLFISKYKNKKMKEAILPYFDKVNFENDDAALLTLFRTGKKTVLHFLEKNYISEKIAFIALQRAYVTKQINQNDYREITDRLIQQYSLTKKIYLENNNIFASMETSDFDYLKNKGYFDSLTIEELVPSLLTSMSLGNKEIAAKLLEFNDEIQNKTSEITVDYNQFKNILFIKNFFLLNYLKGNAVNFGKENPSLANHINFFMERTNMNIMELKQKGNNIIIDLFKKVPDYVLTQEDILILKKYKFNLFEKNNNNEEALDFASKENINVLSKYYLAEIAEKEKEKLLAVLEIPGEKIQDGVKRRL